MYQKISGKIVASVLDWENMFFGYISVFEMNNGEKVYIRSKDAYPIDSYQTLNVKKLKRGKYEVCDNPISFTLQKSIIALVASILAIGSILLYNNDILRTNRAFFKEYLLFGAITCIGMAMAEFIIAKIRVKKLEEEHPTEVIEAMINNAEEDYHTGHSIVGVPYWIEVLYQHKGIEHRGIVRRIRHREPEFGKFLDDIRIYEKTGLLENKNIKWDFYINLYVAVLGFLALAAFLVMA